ARVTAPRTCRRVLPVAHRRVAGPGTRTPDLGDCALRAPLAPGSPWGAGYLPSTAPGLGGAGDRPGSYCRVQGVSDPRYAEWRAPRVSRARRLRLPLAAGEFCRHAG